MEKAMEHGPFTDELPMQHMNILPSQTVQLLQGPKLMNWTPQDTSLENYTHVFVYAGNHCWVGSVGGGLGVY